MNIGSRSKRRRSRDAKRLVRTLKSKISGDARRAFADRFQVADLSLGETGVILRLLYEERLFQAISSEYIDWLTASRFRRR